MSLRLPVRFGICFFTFGSSNSATQLQEWQYGPFAGYPQIRQRRGTSDSPFFSIPIPLFVFVPIHLIELVEHLRDHL